MIGKMLTYEEVKTILDERKKTKNIKYIQTQVPHRSTGSISQILSKYKRWTGGARVDGSLEEFFEEYERNHFISFGGGGGSSVRALEDSKAKIAASTDTMTSLSIDEAIDQLKTAIVQFIDEQVTEQKQKEVQALKKEYETKLQDMQAVMVQAQKTSVIDMLKQKWGHL